VPSDISSTGISTVQPRRARRACVPGGYQDAVQALKDLYPFPAASNYDIEEAMWWAGRIGKGFLGNHVITCDGTAYRIQPRPASPGQPSA
jgi:hypothetical protein